MSGRLVAILVALSTAALSACKGDSTGPAAQDVAGTYIYSFSINSCSAHFTMPIQQSGATFSGTYTGWLVCSGDSLIAAGKVVQGKVSGDSIWFDLDDPSWYDVGVIQGTTWSGTFNVNGTFGGMPVTLAGNFTAVKQ